MKTDNLKMMWIIINYNDLIKSGLEPYEANGVVDCTEYYPIDANFCVAICDDVPHLLTQQNGLIINSVPANGIDYKVVMDGVK